MTKTAHILGARPGTGNIGDAVFNALISGRYGKWGCWTDDCAVNPSGARPPGGSIPDLRTAREYGYEPGPEGHYNRYEAPSYDRFKQANADALVVTLGATYKGHFAEIEDWEVSRILRANLVLPLECVRRYVSAVEADRRLLEGEGMAPGSDHDMRHIVLVGSYAHDHPFTNGTLYCAAKAGIDMAARALGWELTDRNYRVHVIHPYHVQGTPMWEQVEQDVMKSKGMSYEEADAYNRKDLKMPDLLTAEEVAEVICLLLYNDALGWLSGQALNLYGGSR